MTPSQIEEQARARYNSLGDTFWSQDEIFGYLEAAHNELALEAKILERLYSTTTVAGTRGYAFPTNTTSIKRVEYDGDKLIPVSFTEDDVLTLYNSSSTDLGRPAYYSVWNYTIYLRPIPDSALTLTIYSYSKPQAISVTSTLEIPSEFHMPSVYYVLSQMAAKDENYKAAQWYMSLWDREVLRAKRWARLRKQGDSFAAVQDIDMLNGALIGKI